MPPSPWYRFGRRTDLQARDDLLTSCRSLFGGKLADNLLVIHHPDSD